jgi:undecaprenyl-diphosphatase
MIARVSMDLSLWQIVILAITQGATEFLPISSSGHLVVLAAFMAPGGTTEGLEVSDVNIVLHGGTLVSILVFYWQRIWRLVGEDRRLIGLLFVGTLPAVLVGLPLKKFGGEAVLSSPLLAGCLLPVTGIVLLWASRAKPGDKVYGQIGYPSALAIGVAQALAILPGLSRSGMTISAGLRLGLQPQSAATFSFLLAIPVIGGACLLELASMLGEASLNTPLHYLAIGALISFAVGLVSLAWLVRWLERGRFQYFAAWCIPLGAIVVVWQLWG